MGIRARSCSNGHFLPGSGELTYNACHFPEPPLSQSYPLHPPFLTRWHPSSILHPTCIHTHPFPSPPPPRPSPASAPPTPPPARSSPSTETKSGAQRRAAMAAAMLRATPPGVKRT